MSNQATIELSHKVAKTENFVESSVDGEAILMHLDEGNFSSLKSTGLRIWAMMEEPKTVSEICDKLLEEFDVDRPECEQQTLAFLAGLRDRGLIEVR
ncbi:PqqD family peptide modification chaperone [Erythrobacter sp. THAF29]|uniref:PqqD family peptide modification chaperone n=1 Tax=Erythrobacter sp. THAF29 TaxID=2587851 RepID=UPI0012685D8E|nr:PqqD family peptide modification chaperone [Erythrobacter sp. THAF29]QFT78478.1 Coenzyme PQQ synthesis protein D (PqqD) [Erythrobacter sp. THAF29]